MSNLQSHSRCHQTDKPYKCNSCYKCFSDEPSLLEHIPKHKESKHLKTHICQYCGKSYTQETYLSKHMQKHAERTDKRPPIGATLGKKEQNLCWAPKIGISSIKCNNNNNSDPTFHCRLYVVIIIIVILSRRCVYEKQRTASRIDLFMFVMSH